MTWDELREVYAGQAMQALLANVDMREVVNILSLARDVAIEATVFADALVEEMKGKSDAGQ